MIRAIHKNFVLTEEGEIVDTNTGEVLTQLKQYKSIPYSPDNYSTGHLGTVYLSDYSDIDKMNYKILQQILDREPVLTTYKGGLSEISTFLWTQPTYRANVLAGLKKAMAKPSYHRHQSIASTEMWTRPDYRAKQMKIRRDLNWRRELGRAIKLGQNTPEGKKNLSDGQFRRFSDPKERKKVSVAALKKYKERPELKERLRDIAKEQWKDPEYRAKNKCTRLINRANNPEYGKCPTLTHEERSLAAKKAWVTKKKRYPPTGMRPRGGEIK